MDLEAVVRLLEEEPHTEPAHLSGANLTRLHPTPCGPVPWPRPDELKITLTGHHILGMMRRAAEWSALRHGVGEPKEAIGKLRPNLP